ncbi:hypothetical protein Sta7437_3163 [Stanieria cyanosphaera PCC 7437]|uniref:Uncharacterized protein n=1 Tax=Stanieria cyanosphaera (strain ATCC 29371 / PCC 7437) TaxID=111780 RepID=K9XV61_STAC7|nr:hypothetical protein Sta7437_2429 [Stanieria cyanosphaera PCC 7437]AFZ36672.1 hypothetical protein Sta7437_3163 [Stanieria cyanosphaera PCC 7437]
MYAHPTQGLEFPTKRLSGNHYSVPKRTPKDLDQRFMTRLFSEGQ